MTRGRQQLERHAKETSALGSSLADAQLWEDALAAFRESAAVFRSLRDSHPGHEAGYDVLLAVDLNSIGTCLCRLGRFAEALGPLYESAQLFDARRQDDPGTWSGPQAGPLQTMAAAALSAGLHDQALAVSRHAVTLRRAADSRPTADPELAKALRMFAIVRSATGSELDDAMTAADEALGIQSVLVGDDPDNYLPEFCMTQDVRARLLDRLGRTPEALAVRRWLAARPMTGLLPEGTAREEAMTLTFAAVTLIGQGEDQQGIDLLDSLLNRHPDPVGQPLRQPVAVALFNKGVALKHLDRRADEIAVYDEVWRRFGKDTDVQVRHQVARSLVNRSVATNAMRAYVQTLVSADEVLRRYSDDPAPELRIQAAKALFLKANALDGLARTKEVPALVTEIDRRTRAEAENPAVLRALADSRSRIRLRAEHPEPIAGIGAKLRGYVAPREQLPPAVADGAPGVLPGLVMVVAVVEGERADFVPSNSMAALGGTDVVWQQAMHNLESLEGIDVVREEVRPDRDDTTLFTLSGADPFIGSRAAVFEWLVEALTGAASIAHGLLIAVPSRHRLALHVISGPGAVQVAETMALAVHHMHQSAGGAAISPWVYFVTPDRRAQQVSYERDGRIVFYATDLFVGALRPFV